MKQIFKANFDGGQNIRGVSFSSIEKYALLYKIKGVYFPFDIFLEIYTPTEHWGWIFPQSARKCTSNKNSANFRKPSRPALSLLQLCKRSSSPEVSSTPYRVPHHLTRTHHWIKVNGLINCFDCQIKEITLEPGVPSSQKEGQRGKSPWKMYWLHSLVIYQCGMSGFPPWTWRREGCGPCPRALWEWRGPWRAGSRGPPSTSSRSTRTTSRSPAQPGIINQLDHGSRILRGNTDSFFPIGSSIFHGFIESPGRHQIWNWDSCRCLAALSSVYLWPANVSSETIFAAELEVPAHCQRRCLSCNLDAGLPSVAPIPEKNFWNAIILKADSIWLALQEWNSDFGLDKDRKKRLLARILTGARKRLTRPNSTKNVQIWGKISSFNKKH